MMRDERVIYWIKCDRNVAPVRYGFDDTFEMLKTLDRIMGTHGPIEFMIRES